MVDSWAAAMAIKVLICDDEDLARQLLREFLAPLEARSEVRIVGEAGDGFSAVKAAGELKPDLIFLDVQMPKLNGFEVLELLEPAAGRGAPAVIFTTAYDQYALRAFDAHAIDYLLKPFSQERFAAAWERAGERLHGQAREGAGEPAEVERAAAARLSATELARQAQAQPLDRLVVKDGARIAFIPLEQLMAAEAQDDYVALHTAEKTWLKKQTIASLEAQLDPGRFLRVHRGWIVNLTALARLEPLGKERFVLILHNGRQVPVSQAGYERLRQFWGT